MILKERELLPKGAESDMMKVVSNVEIHDFNLRRNRN